METWKGAAVAIGALAVMIGLSIAYSSRLGSEMLAQLEIEALERIPVLDVNKD